MGWVPSSSFRFVFRTRLAFSWRLKTNSREFSTSTAWRASLDAGTEFFYELGDGALIIIYSFRVMYLTSISLVIIVQV